MRDFFQFFLAFSRNLILSYIDEMGPMEFFFWVTLQIWCFGQTVEVNQNKKNFWEEENLNCLENNQKNFPIAMKNEKTLMIGVV